MARRFDLVGERDRVVLEGDAAALVVGEKLVAAEAERAGALAETCLEGQSPKLQADYEKLPAFPIPAHVSDSAEHFPLLGSCALLDRFDDGSIGLWWPTSKRRDEALMPLAEGRVVWNRMGKHWHMAAEADEVVRDLRRLATERARR